MRLFGLPIANLSLQEATRGIITDAQNNVRRQVVFINAHCINTARRDKAYREFLQRQESLYADGSGLMIAAKAIGEPLVDNVNGTDMFPQLCELAAQENVPLAFIGAQTEIVNRCSEKMKERFPGLNVVYQRNGYFDSEEDEAQCIAEANASGARILLIAMGVPKQEFFVEKHQNALTNIPIVMAVGGLFDFYSGLRIRAHWILRKLGLEWTVRLAQEPRRLARRYLLGNPEFLFHTFRLQMIYKLRSTL